MSMVMTPTLVYAKDDQKQSRKVAQVAKVIKCAISVKPDQWEVSNT